MGNTLIILLSYILNFILIILIISLIIRIRNVERKLINFSPTEAYSILENMHEMVLESQRLADSLEAGIKGKESVVEDLSDLVDEKILRYEKISGEKYSFKQPEKKEPVKNIIPEVKKESSSNIQEIKGQEQIKQPETKKDLKSKILELSNSGKASIDIARELGISITEVQLALRLTPKG